jgi:hypothetical protein
LHSGRFLHRPGAAGGPGGDHPWPCRSRAPRAWQRAGHRRNAHDHGDPLWRELCRAARKRRSYGEVVRLGDTKVSLHPAGHVLGSAQVLVEHGRATGWWPRATTSATPTRRSHPLRWCRATPSSPKRRSACRCFAIHRAPMRSPNFWPRFACFPTGRIWSAPTRWARRSG